MIPDVDDFFTISKKDDLRNSPPNYKIIYLRYFLLVVAIPGVLLRISFAIDSRYVQRYMDNNEIVSRDQAFFEIFASSIFSWSFILLLFSLVVLLILSLLHLRDRRRVEGRLDVPPHQHNPQWIKVKTETYEEYMAERTWLEKYPNIAYSMVLISVGITGIVFSVLMVLIVGFFF